MDLGAWGRPQASSNDEKFLWKVPPCVYKENAVGGPSNDKKSLRNSLQWRPYGALLRWSGTLLALGPPSRFSKYAAGLTVVFCALSVMYHINNVVFWRLAWYRDNIDASMVTLVGGLWTLLWRLRMCIWRKMTSGSREMVLLLIISNKTIQDIPS